MENFDFDFDSETARRLAEGRKPRRMAVAMEPCLSGSKTAGARIARELARIARELVAEDGMDREIARLEKMGEELAGESKGAEFDRLSDSLDELADNLDELGDSIKSPDGGRTAGRRKARRRAAGNGAREASLRDFIDSVRELLPDLSGKDRRRKELIQLAAKSFRAFVEDAKCINNMNVQIVRIAGTIRKLIGDNSKELAEIVSREGRGDKFRKAEGEFNRRMKKLKDQLESCKGMLADLRKSLVQKWGLDPLDSITEVQDEYKRMTAME